MPDQESYDSEVAGAGYGWTVGGISVGAVIPVTAIDSQVAADSVVSAIIRAAKPGGSDQHGDIYLDDAMVAVLLVHLVHSKPV